MSDTIGIKNELVVRLDPEECFVQTKLMLTTNYEASEEEASTTSHF